MKLRFIIADSARTVRLMVSLSAFFLPQAEYSRAEPKAPFPVIASQTSDPKLAAEIQAHKDLVTNFFEAIEKGDLETVKKTLVEHPELLNSHDYYNDTPLYRAVGFRKVEVARFLLERGANPNDTATGRYPIDNAVSGSNTEMVRVLLGKGAKINAAPGQAYGMLFSAVHNSSTEMLQTLLGLGIDIKSRDKTGRTALHEALNSQLEAAKLLIEKGADINARDSEGETPVFKIQFSVMSEKIYRDTLDYLLAHGADLKAQSAPGNTILHQIVIDNHSALFSNGVQVLLEKGVDPNIKNNRGDLALHLALLNTSAPQPALKALIEKTDLSIQSGQGLTSLLIALGQRLPIARDLIVARRAPAGTIEKFFDAAAQDDTSTLRAMLAKESWLVQARLSDGSTALHIAALWWATDAIKALIEAGADVEARDAHSRSPLLRAVRWESDKLKRPDAIYPVKALLARHANPVVSDDEASTPLHNAVAQGQFDLVEMLVNAQVTQKISLDLRDKTGRTPLLKLLESTWPDSTKIAQLLIEKGADVNARSTSGLTPMAQAARANNTEVLAALLAKGTLLDSEGDDSPLGGAITNKAQAAAQFLIEKGADINRPVSGYSMLERAIYNDSDDLAKLLITKGTDLNARYRGDQTPLTRAVMRNKKDLIILLLQKGVDVNASNSDGKTALQIAQRELKTEIIELLQKGGEKH